MEYITYSISIIFISWIIGMILNEGIKNKSFYASLSNLNFIESEKINQIIGLGYFKWVVKNTFFKFFNQKIILNNKTTELSELRKEMTNAEISHLIGFISVVFVALYKSVSNDYLYGLTLMFFNVLMNLYPSLLQQENKRRIDNITTSFWKKG